ncbi:MAG TPA: ABC transporter permease [Solirubrobacteraceae bacterium]|nr:ABC transporter permease [Solirubrobacteraceae bacterium]
MSTVPTVPGLSGMVRRRTRGLAGSDKVAVVCLIVIAVALVVAVVGPALAPHDPNASNLNDAFVGPGGGHLLGYDSQGRDLLSRLLAGARTSILGPAAVVVIAVLVGVVLAVVSAWRGGWVDSGISIVMDILFAFPGILLAILAAAVFGPGLTAAALSLAIAYTPYVARVLRSAAVRERAREYIAASEVQGLSAWAICGRHLVPNVTPLIVSQGTLLFGYAMVDLAAISFIGLGVQPPQADWGVMVSTGQAGVLQGYPAESLSAGLCIVAVVVAVNLLGERLAQRNEERR